MEQVLLEEPRKLAEQGGAVGARERGARGGHLVHPERGDPVGVFLGLPDRRREAPERRRHARERVVHGRSLAQIHPRDAQVIRVVEAVVRHLAALQRARQLHVRHIVTIS
jgi:hypothetical protein